MSRAAPNRQVQGLGLSSVTIVAARQWRWELRMTFAQYLIADDSDTDDHLVLRRRMLLDKTSTVAVGTMRLKGRAE